MGRPAIACRSGRTTAHPLSDSASRERPPVRSRPTLADVARLCGVNPSTVSRVLNKKATFSASPAVRQKIQDAAERLGYVPDLAARNLNQRTTRFIGMFASPSTHVSEGIYEPLIEGVLEVLHASDYDVFFDLSVSRRNRVPVLALRPGPSSAVTGNLKKFLSASDAEIPDRVESIPFEGDADLFERHVRLGVEVNELASARFGRGQDRVSSHEPNAAENAVELHERVGFFQRMA